MEGDDQRDEPRRRQRRPGDDAAYPIVAIPATASLDEAQELMLTRGHLRLPVFTDSIDRIVGVLLAHDLWRAAREGVRDLKEVLK